MEVNDDALASSLEGLNWDYLRTKKKEFIVKMVIKRIKKEGWKVTREKVAKKKVMVVPVTTFTEGPYNGTSIFVYELFRGWAGELLHEKAGNCKVRIRENEDSKYITTFILKKDLQDYDGS